MSARILLADDHELVRDAIAMFMKSEGVVDLGPDAGLGEVGAEGVSAFPGDPDDVLVVDVPGIA